MVKLSNILLHSVMLATCVWAESLYAIESSDVDLHDEKFADKNFEELFSLGKSAYLANDWSDCIDFFEAAIADYHFYTDTITQCKMQCAGQKFQPLFHKDIENLHFYEGKVRATLCLMKCKKAKISARRVEQIMPKTLEAFESMETYNYLQLCYYKLNNIKKAAAAALTHYVHNTDDEVSKSNLDYYFSKLDEKQKEEVSNREAYKHTVHFNKGREHYVREEWKSAIEEMEMAVQKLVLAEEMCRHACEKPFDMGWFPDFVTSVANHFAFCLKCKQNCKSVLSNLDGEQIDKLLPTMYNYLQYSYYQTGQLPKASECVASYLHLDPEDEPMINNKEYYMKKSNVPLHWFVVRNEAVTYKQREDYEESLSNYIETNFVFETDEPMNVIDDKNATSSNFTEKSSSEDKQEL